MRNYSVNTEGHNTATVDGLGQCRFEHHWGYPENWAHTKEDVRLLEEDRFDYARGSYRDRYGVCDSSKLQRPPVPGRELAEHVREVILMKRPASGKPYFIAVDTLTDKVSEEHTYDVLWHFNSKDVKVDGCRAFSQELTFVSCGFDSLEVIKGREEPFAGWLTSGSRQGQYYAAPTLDGRVFGKDAAVVSLFYLDSAENCPVLSVAILGRVLTVNYRGGLFDSIDLDEAVAKSKNCEN